MARSFRLVRKFSTEIFPLGARASPSKRPRTRRSGRAGRPAWKRTSPTAVPGGYRTRW